MRWVFKHFPLRFHADAPLAHRAALAAGEQGKFWEMHDLIFAQSKRCATRRFDRACRPALGSTRSRFVDGLDDASRFAAIVKRDVAEGKRVGVDGTPTFFVNGQRLDRGPAVRGLQGRDRSRAGQSAARLPSPTRRRRVRCRIRCSSSAMSIGPADAAVTIRWFADFGSPLHRDAVALLKRVVAAHPRDVRIVFHHRPLEGRPQAWLSHEASLAAAEQGKFWELHDLLLNRPAQDRNVSPPTPRVSALIANGSKKA